MLCNEIQGAWYRNVALVGKDGKIPMLTMTYVNHIQINTHDLNSDVIFIFPFMNFHLYIRDKFGADEFL